jgi:Rod binding domain-containing protein
MRDLVESVIDGLLQQERMQQRRSPRKIQPQQHQVHYLNSGGQVRDAHKQRDPELWKVSTQFEAIFVQQMLSEMRKTVHKSGFMPSGFAEDVHASMMDEAIAQSSVRHSNFGIAENIYRQLQAAQSARETQAEDAPAQGISASADKLKMHDQAILEAASNAH